MSIKKHLTTPTQCRHCYNTVPLDIEASYSQVSATCDAQGRTSYDEGYIYELLLCPTCKGVSVRRYYYHDFASNPEDIELEILYPATVAMPEGLPQSIQKAYEAAS